ncbi:hypothetical protein SAMN04487839_1178 [Streptococcus gallolyticus]|uniref:Uncharacterized protein n=1 Tax=Streptococcus gallolyticus TaxID=315405 RepID=A0A1H7XN78_9STRE|nr:hypothetical protein SAMN02910295_1426 [Streptococcus gallolyticus]SEM35226.1 hypothetical protein SAMN04487839_1178 [Streptococcus gallolyticus]SER87644.1 hypothetical protein SAMN04487840_1114 [Streptococcus gallolyticus]
MLKIKYHRQFIRDYKLALKRGLKVSRWIKKQGVWIYENNY